MAGSVDEIYRSPLTMSIDHNQQGASNRALYNFYNDYSHIHDSNLRRRLALSEIDKVPFGLHHIRAILVSGGGFLLDSYDFFSINLVTTLLGLVFWSTDDTQDDSRYRKGAIPYSTKLTIKVSATVGIIIGMVTFGWLADALGRRRMYGLELVIIIVGTAGCSLVSASPSVSASGLLIFWRIVMGIGIGAEYPLSSVITSEFAPTRWRGGMIAAVFSMQGLGSLLSAIVALVTTVSFKNSYLGISDEEHCDMGCREAADRSWRIIVGFGAIPACLALYYRLTIPETPRYTFDIQHDVEKADADIRAYVDGEYKSRRNSRTKAADASLNLPRASRQDALSYFGQRENFKVLIGSMMSWFFVGFACHGLGLNSAIILGAIGYADGGTLYQKLFSQALGMIILSCAGAIPGHWTAIATIDTVGRKPLQVTGFFMLAILFCIMGFRIHDLSEGTILALFIIGVFVFNAGPNTTTFIVPVERFPTRYRATGHGVSAAMGKVGTIVAQAMSIPLLNAGDTCLDSNCWPKLDRVIQLLALFMFLGGICTLCLIPETKGLTLEELSGEARTSYNAGCNGSIILDSPRLDSWNPFRGGQPAGFCYRRSTWGKWTRDSVFPQPGAAAERSRSVEGWKRWRKKRRWRKFGNRRQAGSHDLNDIALRSCGPGGTSANANGSPTDGASGGADSAMDQQQLPTWGAGWGRIDRGVPPSTRGNMQLQDVGMLLRPT